ncbi:MAG: bifunctional precorrin-2 dehydrogenase/sirohydrochlorin ferrochelatase [Candidatus Acidiferrales bacterium]
MSLFPMFVKLRDRLCIVVGGGEVAAAKIPGLIAAQAKIRVIAPEVNQQITGRVREGLVEWRRKQFESGDLADAYLVVAATNVPDVNHEVYGEAEARGILCNAVDDPEYCHFYYPSVVRRGELQIAISTEGLSPALAQRLRRELEAQFGPEYEPWLRWLGAVRKFLRSTKDDSEGTKQLLHELASREMFEKFLQQTTGGQGSRSAQ